jgi:hypothetical protein
MGPCRGVLSCGSCASPDNRSLASPTLRLMASAERLERLRDAEAPAEIAFTALAERIEVLTPSLERFLG